MEVPRRTVLAVGLGLIVGGCAGHGSSAKPSPAASTTQAPTPTPIPSPAATEAVGRLPPVTVWRPSPGDLEPACKLAAVRAIEHAGNSAHRRIHVIVAQYGGLLSDSASVLVATRSSTLVGDVVRAGGRTYDVRLTLHGGRWRVDAVNPSRPGGPGSLSGTARQVLSSARIDLPPAARRDLESGQVHEAPLRALLGLSKDFRVGVSVVRSGHPLYVFGTSRLSDHPQGRAFDTWQIDGRAVVDPRTSRQLVTEYMHAVAGLGAYNVGGPYLLGPAPQWFSDATHHDHVHAGFPV